MKKKLLLGLCILAFSYSSNGQFGNISSKQLEVLKNSKLLVVESDDYILDSLVEHSIQELWDFTPYKIVSQQEAQSHYGDPGYSFLTFVSYRKSFERGGIIVSNLALVLTNKKDAKKEELNFEKNTVGYMMLDNYNGWKNTGVKTTLYNYQGDNSFFYKWNDLFKCFVNFFKLAEQNNGMSQGDFTRHSNLNKNELKDHILLIESTQLNSVLQEDTALLSSLYLFDFRIATDSEIFETIRDVNTDYAYLYTAAAGKGNFTMIFESGTGKILLLDHASSEYGAVTSKIDQKFMEALMANFRE